MRHLISQNIVSRGFLVGTLAAIFGAVSFSVPSPAFAVAPNQNPVKIFSEDFESGNFSKWITCGNQITTNLVHSGARAFHFVRGHVCATFLSQPVREVYNRYYWFIPTGFNFSVAPGKHFGRFGSGDTGNYLRNGSIDTTSNGNAAMNFDYFLGSGGPFYKGQVILPTGRWFKYELYTRLNDPGVVNGEARVWIDGVLQLNRSNVTLNATSNNLNIFMLTTNYDNCIGTCDWYMDDVEVWNGCPSGSSCNGSPSAENLAPPSNLRFVPGP